MSGFKRERPRPKKRLVQWDLKLVLEFFKTGRFSTWDTLTNKYLTLKTVFLTALASGKRRSELHALRREGVADSFGSKRGKLLYPLPSFVSKTQMKTDLGALTHVFIPRLETEDPVVQLLCPAECLMRYIRQSDIYRSTGQKQLFISWQEGKTNDLTVTTISSYIKKAVLMAYEEADDDLLSNLKVVPHTVRHVASSLKALRSCSLQEIMQAGTWASPNTFISHYLVDFTTDSLKGLSNIGGLVAAGSQI